MSRTSAAARASSSCSTQSSPPVTAPSRREPCCQRGPERTPAWTEPYVAILDQQRFELAADDDTPLLMQDAAAAVVVAADSLLAVASAADVALAAAGSALGTGAAGIAAIGAWKRAFLQNKAAPFILVAFVGAPLSQTIYGMILRNAIQGAQLPLHPAQGEAQLL